jgi:hypothetical protein
MAAAGAGSATPSAAAAAVLPPTNVLLRAASIAIEEDRPVLLDYWVESRKKECCIGVRDKEKHLVKSDSEYTSPIQNIFQLEGCFIVLTENSLYIVSKEIPVRKIVSELKGE